MLTLPHSEYNHAHTHLFKLILIINVHTLCKSKYNKYEYNTTQNNSVNWGHVKRLLPYFILYKKFSFLAVSKKTPSISIWGSRHKICERRALGVWTKRTFSIHKTATCLLLSLVCLGKSFRIRIRKLEMRFTNVAYWDLRNCFLFNCIILW